MIDLNLSVDVEFTINGCFTQPQHYRPLGVASLQRVDEGVSHGLGFILDTLERYQLKGTFFCEMFQSHYFGDAPMQGVMQEIVARGHDVQLHLHPAWRIFRHSDWLQRLTAGGTPSDAMHGLGEVQAIQLLEEGMACFKRVMGYAPLAFRGGSLHVDETLYRVVAQLGIPMASCQGYGFFAPGDVALRRLHGLHDMFGLREVPVTTYTVHGLGGRRWYKALTVTGTPAFLFWKLLRQGVMQQSGPLVVLTHASEFSTMQRDPERPRFVPHRGNQSRFERLCRFLDRNRAHIRTSTFSQGLELWSAQPSPPLRVGMSDLLLRHLFNHFQRP
ncbi:polysaccharide deacetylase [Magnetococcus marinus MC-1]|uniref:Polysaccharide deacetylase n=1 Tax=Magnetococcus marinus (strain ATCC BAA-1437 / JCM 17883 / MC-1) TaxID=156889 RepID=A0L6U3_MAGMM|nr:polysaccharide deacetylase [Magnetococcus marinus]ABK43686.1 polysaccharide deacetylase [Magnetococcus marinus MC-1]